MLVVLLSILAKYPDELIVLLRGIEFQKVGLITYTSSSIWIAILNI
jgi:hypothetical protein